MATFTGCCGFECGVFGDGTHWASANGAVSISTSVVRTGARALRANPSASTDARVTAIKSDIGGVYNAQAAHGTPVIGRVYVRFATLPSVDCFLIKAGGATYGGVVFQASDSKIYAGFSTGARGATGVAVTTDVWYRLDFKVQVDASATTDTADVQVDGVACGQSTITTLSAGGSVFLGVMPVSGNITADVYFDDWAVSATVADYPIGAGFVSHFVPTADGTHNVAGINDFERGDGPTDINNSTTDAYTLIDDIPLDANGVTPSTTDSINAIAPPNSTDYVECVIGPAPGVSTPTTAPRFVSLVGAFHQSGTQQGTSTLTCVAAGATSTGIAVGPNNVAGTTTVRHGASGTDLINSGADPWTVDIFNALRIRFGAADAAPDQYLDGVSVEAEFVPLDTVVNPGAGSLSLAGLAPSLGLAFGIGASALALTGHAPTVSVTTTPIEIAVPAGSLSLSGQTPTLGYIYTPGTGQLTLTGHVPTASVAHATSPPTGTLTLTGQAPTLIPGVGRAPAAGTLTLTGLEPSLRFDLTVVPAAGALTLTGQAPTLSTGQIAQPGAGSLIFTGQAPTLAHTVPVGAGALTLTGQAPALITDHRAYPDAGSLTFTGYAPSLSPSIPVPAGSLTLTGQTPLRVMDHRAQPAAVALSFTGYAPTIDITEAAFTVFPDVGTLTLTGLAPTLAHILPVGAGTLTLTGQAPSLLTFERVAPAAGTLTLTGFAPSLAHTLPVGVGSLTLTGLAPTLAHTLPVGAGSLSLTGLAPSLVTAHLAQPGAGTLTLTGYAPSVVGTGAVEPGMGALTLTGYAPTLRFDYVAAPAPGALTLSGQTPTVSIGEYVQPDAGSLTLTGLAPTLAHTLPIGAGSLTLTGYAPSLGGTVTIQVPAGSLSLTGQVPVLAHTIPVGAGTLTLTGTTPSFASTVLVPAGTLTLTGYAPQVLFGLQVVTPNPAVLTLTGYAPTVLDIAPIPGVDILEINVTDQAVAVAAVVNQSVRVAAVTGSAVRLASVTNQDVRT